MSENFPEHPLSVPPGVARLRGDGRGFDAVLQLLTRTAAAGTGSRRREGAAVSDRREQPYKVWGICSRCGRRRWRRVTLTELWRRLAWWRTGGPR